MTKMLFVRVAQTMAGKRVVRRVLSMEKPASFHWKPFWKRPMYVQVVGAE